MERKAMSKLEQWKNSEQRKPLLLRGARQTGKTWLLKEFGKRFYENTVLLDFEQNRRAQSLFDDTLIPDDIILQIQLLTGQKIHKEKTLLIFDEAQRCPDALTALKYFAEDAPEYHIIAAGSLLGITLARPAAFPVGKVDIMDLGTMDFEEVLTAGGDEELALYLKNVDKLEPMPEAVFSLLSAKLKNYYITGGMPEVVQDWINHRDWNSTEELLYFLLETYAADFGKYSSKTDIAKIRLIWDSLPSQLSRENKKFLYSAAKPGARAREYENAIEWLKNARIIRKVFRSTAAGLPVASYDDLSSFKLYMPDVGLLRRHAGLNPSVISEGQRLFTEFKGALTENYALLALERQFGEPRYWAETNPPHEVDFIVQWDNWLVPVEVKAETNIRSRSLKIYKEKYSEKVKLCVRLSMGNLKLDGDLLNIPLFMADETERLVRLAMGKIC